MKYQLHTNVQIKETPENLYDVLQILSHQGIIINNIRMYNENKEMIPCVEDSTGIYGFYDTINNEFKTVVECLQSFPTNSKISFE